MRRSPHGRACRCGCPNSRPSGRTRPPRPRGRTRRPPRRQQPQLSTQSRQVTISAQIQKSSIIESQVPINENRPHFWLINIRMVRKIHLPNIHGESGWVDSYSGCSIVCPILLRHMGIRKNWPYSRARWWNIKIKVNPAKVRDHQIHPVVAKCSLNHNIQTCFSV